MIAPKPNTGTSQRTITQQVLRLWPVFLLITIFFGAILIPKWLPSVGGWFGWSVYFFFVFAVLLILVIIGIWGSFGLLRAKIRGVQSQSHNYLLGFTSGYAMVWMIIVLVIARTVPGALPTGSYTNQFDQTAWLESDSLYFFEDISPRQLMLGDLVNNHLQGKNYAQIEELLGLSQETEYFTSSGYDLIYYLGNQRDSWLALDSEWLLIWLDDSGQFKKYEIYND